MSTGRQGSVKTSTTDNPLYKAQDVSIHIAKVSEQQQRQQQRRHTTRTALAWVKEHPWWSGSILLLTLIIVTALILLPICATRYCPGIPLWKPPDDPVTEPQQGPPRLILKFLDPSLDALTQLPAVLRPYTNRSIIDSCNIQILQFIDEDTLNSARQYFQSNYDLQLLVRDFSMMRFPFNSSSSGGSTTVQDIINTTAPYVDLLVPGNGSSALENLLSSIFSRSTKDSSGGSGSSSSNNNSSSSSSSSSRSLLQADTTLQAYAANDPLLRNGSQWFQKQVQSDYSWLLSKGSSEVIVAIVDTGADLSHPDLRTNLWVNQNEIPGNGIDDDGNGFIDDVNGWDFAGACLSVGFGGTCACGAKATPSDDDGHGTHVAGIIASVQDNWLGGSGVAPGVKLMILRVSDCVDDTIYASAVVAAYDYALRMGAHVVQCSFGMSYPDHFSPTAAAPWYHSGQIQMYTSAITPLADKGILVVAAAGNEYLDLDQLDSLGYSYNPCLVKLPNVICVAASDSTDQLTSFSNRGVNTVHVAAPGTAITSTMKSSSYATLTGTSMAAPIVSGVAALGLSILGSTSGNYYHSVDVKSMIMTYGNRVPGLAVSSSSRINALNVSLAAMVQASAANNSLALVLVQPNLPAAADLPLSLGGCTETYINLAAAAWGLPLQRLAPTAVTDVSVRSAALLNARTSFKYGSGYAVLLTSYVLLNSTGLYKVQVGTEGGPDSSTTTPSILLFMNGTRIQLSAADGSGAFQVATPGYFSFELQLLLPVAALSLNLTSLSGTPIDPSATFLTTAQQATTSAGTPAGLQPETSSSSFQPPGLELVSGWQTSYSISRASIWIQPTAAPDAYLAVNPVIDFAYQTLLPDLNFNAASTLSLSLVQGAAASAPAILSSGLSGASVLGKATTRLRASDLPSSFILSSSCTRCMVWVDGLLVIDNWEGPATRNPALVLRKDSTCIRIPSGSPQPLITVTFSGSSLLLAQLNLGWTPCGATSTTTTPLSLADLVSTSALWQPASNDTGSTTGLQCDVWRSGSLPQLQQASGPGSQGTQAPGAPAFKFRKARGNWSHTLMDLLPGIETRYPPTAATPHLLSVRCWTYMPAPTNLSVTLPASAGLLTTPSAKIQLGGRTLSLYQTSLSPTLTLSVPDDWNTLIVVEWQNVTVDLPLTVTSSGTPLLINPFTAVLPLLVQPPQDPDSLTAPSFLGPHGHFSNTSLADPSLEAAPLLQYDQSSLLSLGTYSSLVQGLDGTFSYNSALNSQLRYTVSEGYFQATADGVQKYTFRMLDDASTATGIVMAPGVSIINPRAFSAQNPQLAVQQSITLPPGFIYTEAVAKTVRPDGQTAFYLDVKLPDCPQAHADGVVDSTVWYHVYGRGYR